VSLYHGRKAVSQAIAVELIDCIRLCNETYVALAACQIEKLRKFFGRGQILFERRSTQPLKYVQTLKAERK
jgi:hypothetical protein